MGEMKRVSKNVVILSLAVALIGLTPLLCCCVEGNAVASETDSISSKITRQKNEVIEDCCNLSQYNTESKNCGECKCKNHTAIFAIKGINFAKNRHVLGRFLNTHYTDFYEIDKHNQHLSKNSCSVPLAIPRNERFLTPSLL